MSISTGTSISRRRLAITLLGSLVNGKGAEGERWLVYYSNAAPVAAFDAYSTLILDSRYYPPLEPLVQRGKTLVGYLSLGEASPDYSYFGWLRSEGLLVRPSATWKGNYFIDIRDERWVSRVCDQIAPQILGKGFQGLFFDTLDNPLYLEETDPVRYRGMKEAAAELVRAIRRRYPRITLVMNRAYGLLDAVADEIDVALGESVYTTYDFERKKYGFVEAAVYRRQVEMLQGIARRRPELKIFTLDYWDPADAEGIARIYKEQRSNGFSPYVTSIDLTRIVSEPGS